MAIKLVAIVLVVLMFVFQIFAIPDSMRDCLQKEGFTEEEASTFLNRSTVGEVTPRKQCIAACIMASMNVLDGCHLKYEEAKKKYTMEERYDLVLALDACKDSVQGSERCECGYEVFNCIDDYYEKHVRA